MKLFNDVRNYIGENNFRIILYKDKLDILNYDIIDELNNNKIILNSSTVIIEGKDLKVKRLLNKELLVLGKIINIKFNE